MANNLQGSIDLLKLENTGLATIKGVRCVVIPLVGNDFYITKDELTGKAKAIYMGINIFEAREAGKYGDTHYAKRSLSKEFREGASAEELERRRKIYIGNFKPLVLDEGANAAGTVAAPTLSENEIDTEDLPF